MKVTEKFVSFLKENDSFDQNLFIVGGGAQQATQKIYTPQADKPSFFGNLISKAIEFKLMGSMLKKSMAVNLGTAAAEGAVLGTATKTGIFSRIGATVMPFLSTQFSNPWFWAGVGAVSVGTWGYFYLSGDENMYEIEEGWKDGLNAENHKTTEVYKLMGSTLHNSAFLGIRIINDLFQSENLYMRVDIKDQSIASAFDKGVHGLLNNSIVVKSLYNNQDLNYWITSVKNSYRGIPVSGKKDVKDYSLLKSYVAKYELENSGGKNPYGVPVAEEAEGVYDTFFGQFVPGMSSFGYASFMLSEDYLNNINNVVNLTQNKFLYKLIQTWWTQKIRNFNITEFSIQNLVDFLTWITGGKTYLSVSDFNNVQICERTNDINADPDVKYSMQELLNITYKKVNEEIKKSMEGESKLPHTNVTMSFALFCSCFMIMDILTNSFATQVAMYEAYKRQQMDIAKKEMEETQEFKAKYAEEVIDGLMQNIDLNKYEG